MSLPTLTEFRQSTLRAMEVCPRRTMHDLKTGDVTTGWTGYSADLGTVFHAFAAEYIRTLQRPECRGEVQMSTEEAVNVAREVYDASPVVLPAKEYDALIGMVLGFCEIKWDVSRVLFIEEPMRVELLCPDGEIRTFKGQPDLVLADPPYGVVIVDYKTGWAKPKAPREGVEDGATIEGEDFLSDVGKYQRQAYGCLVLHEVPAARYAVLKELPMRWPKEGPRVARLERSKLEHVEARLASHMMKLDRGLREGEASEVWKPRPGAHCARQCPVSRSCPVPLEQRGEGGIENEVQAHAAAQAAAKLEGKRTALLGSLKAWCEDPANPLPRVNEREVYAWKPATGRGRRFGLHALADVVSATEIEGVS